MFSPSAFLQRLSRFFDQFDALIRSVAKIHRTLERLQLSVGRLEARQTEQIAPSNLRASEFQVFSQWGEDGIIQFLIRHVPIARPIFVEFGVEDYSEANTRFLLTQNNWSGLILDGSTSNMHAVQKEALYWRHSLKAVPAFVTRENINSLLTENGIQGEIGLLSVDVDGNDYWIWEAIQAVNPAIVITEYNARFGPSRMVTVPYDPAFERGKAHSSMIYYGASLAALVSLGKRKGYAFVGANAAGNNAFFVRRDLLPSTLPELTAEEGFMPCRFRETRDERGKLVFLSPEEEVAILQSLPLVEVGV